MKQYFFLIAVLVSLAGAQTGRFARATEAVRLSSVQRCTDGISRFGKVSCGENADHDPLLQAYFYGATSIEEIAKTYPERFEKLKLSCRKKATTRAPASAAPVPFRVESVDVCNGKRGYQEPCVRNEDCLENVCHLVRGTCSTVFTVPSPFGP
jgi:hypothetical protein